MGNVNGREEDDDGDGNGSSTVEEDGQEQDDMAAGGDGVNVQHDDPVSGADGDFMGQSPPDSPRASQSPLLFRPQMPLVPLHRPNETHNPSPSWMQTSSGYEEMYDEQGIPTMFTWSYGGSEVAVEGSWDNGKSRTLLEKSGKDLTIVKVLPSGFYQYRFIVDGHWRHAPDMPWIEDEAGNCYNTLDLKEYVPDDIESIAGFEPPQSPNSSYNNSQFVTEDFAKEPPIVPQHLQMTLLNVPTSNMEIIPVSVSRPHHVVLNHLYMQKGRSSPSVVALGSTHRFMSKYVTVVLYKSMQR